MYRQSSDPGLIYELAPGAEEEIDGVLYANNAHGFRDDPFPDAPPPDALRIVVLGDSVAMGLGAPLRKAFPQVLEDLLQSRADNSSAPPIVYNLSVGGYTTAQEIRMLETRGREFKPDLIVLVYVMNDPDTLDGGLAYYYTAPKLQLLRVVKAAATWSSILVDNIEQARQVGRDYYRHVHQLYQDRIVADFERLGRLQIDFSAPILVAYCPAFNFRTGEPYAWDDIRDRIEALCHDNALAFFDFLDAFAGYESGSLSEDGVHPNEFAHELMGMALLERIETLLTPNPETDPFGPSSAGEAPDGQKP